MSVYIYDKTKVEAYRDQADTKSFSFTEIRAIATGMTPPASAPRVTIARPARSNGVLSIPASATQKRVPTEPEVHNSKPVTSRLKIVIRRLPPGLTQAEFEDALGDNWRLGKGRVDWAIYKEGKISKEYGDHSRNRKLILMLIQATQSCQTL